MTCFTDGRAGKVRNSHVRWLPAFFDTLCFSVFMPISKRMLAGAGNRICNGT